MPPAIERKKAKREYTKEDLAISVKKELNFLVASALATLGSDLIGRILASHSCRIRTRGSRCSRVALMWDILVRCSESFARRGSGIVKIPHNS